MNKKTKKMIYIALFTALTTVLTMFPRIPWGGGYLHAGDSMILLSAISMGPTAGVFVGAIGSSLADVFSGYASYAVFTFLIKGLMGFCVAMIAYKSKTSHRKILAILLGVLIMISGYFVADLLLYRQVITALSNALGNLFQAAASIIVTLLFLPVIPKIFGSDELLSVRRNIIK